MQSCETLYERADIARADRPIRLGSLLFTMVEPRPGYEVAYNRWYERDHFYSGCMIGAYTVSGARYNAARVQTFDELNDLAGPNLTADYTYRKLKPLAGVRW